MLINSSFFSYQVTSADIKSEEFDIESEIDSQQYALIQLNPTHSIYDGHFPGQPVLPGVCIIQMIKEIISDISGLNLDLIESRNVKFIKPINPNNVPEIQLDLKLKSASNVLSVSCFGEYKSDKYFKLSARFAVRK